VLGIAGGALLALAAVLGIGLFLSWDGETATAVPRFVEEAEAAGVHHVYAGEFPYFVGGGVATFDCDDDHRPDLYLAGGANAAALYRNESPVGGALRFTKISDPATDLTRVLGAYPIERRRDGLSDLAGPAATGERAPARAWATVGFERANEAWGYDGGHALTAAFSATWEGSDVLPTLAFGNYLDLANAPDRSACADNDSCGRRRVATRTPRRSRSLPGYCTLSILFSDWDRSGHTDLRMANDRRLLPGRRGATVAHRAGRTPTSVHARGGVATPGDLGHGDRELRRHRRRPARGLPDEPGGQQAADARGRVRPAPRSRTSRSTRGVTQRRVPTAAATRSPRPHGTPSSRT
jgi:hypothetical protein